MMRRQIKRKEKIGSRAYIAVCLGGLLALSISGCGKSTQTAETETSQIEADRPPSIIEADPAERPTKAPKAPPVSDSSYTRSLATEIVKDLAVDRSQGESAIRGLYRYLIEKVYFADPVGLDAWRYLSDETDPIPYLENRSISPFLFGIGSCEDFAAAMVLLLRAAGFEAEYVAGFTVSVDGAFVDHAWTVVQLGGQWYHLDPQLEQNIIFVNQLNYRYYLKSDDVMVADHRWGENLISYWALPEEEITAIRERYTPPVCSYSYPAASPETICLPEPPNMQEVGRRIWEIRNQRGSGQLPPISLNVEPPILVREHHITPPLVWE